MALTNKKNNSTGFALRTLIMISVSILVGLLAWTMQLERPQIISCSIFIMIIIFFFFFFL